jgi:hypothetical protein
MFWRKNKRGAEAAIGHLIYGNLSVDELRPRGSGDLGEPWSSFERARQLLQSGQQDGAARIWQSIADNDGLESRHTLQAWHFLRQAGHKVPTGREKEVLGVIIEFPVGKLHDTLAAYRDGRARYFNHSGKAVIWEDGSNDKVQNDKVQKAITDSIASGQVIARTTGFWDKPVLPDLPVGHGRLTALTLGGLCFGQGPMKQLEVQAIADQFIAPAIVLLQLLITLASTVPKDPSRHL